MASEIVVNEKQEIFIQALIESGGSVAYAAEKSGYNIQYCYILKTKLAKEIVEATKVYLALHTPKAARLMVDTLDDEMPNPIKITAAKDILDRSGVSVKTDEGEKQIIKQNIFILPEKRPLQIIDAEFNERP